MKLQLKWSSRVRRKGKVSDAAGSGGRGEAAMERKKTASGMENFVF